MTVTTKCILCNNSSVFSLQFIKTYKKLGKRSYLRCPECDLIFVPEQYHLLHNDEEARYRLHNNTLSNEGYVNMFSEMITIIHQFCPDIKSALDFGCGPEPVLAQLLKRNGLDCDVFDPIFFPEYPENSYDLIISTEVFEHFRDIRKELKYICSILKPGGFLAIMTLFHDSVKDFESWWYHSDPTHICFLSMKTFQWISRQSGLKIIFSNQKNFIIFKK